jgi:hypothetical protein
MEISPANPSDYIASLPDVVRADVELLDREINTRIPDASRQLFVGKFWGGSDQNIIGYGDFTYTNSSGNDVTWFLVGLAVQKNHLSMYVNAVDDDGYILRRYADKLGKVKIGSASIGFKNVEAINLDAMMELVEVAAASGAPPA